jgi:Domain of unknown function DUF29
MTEQDLETATLCRLIEGLPVSKRPVIKGVIGYLREQDVKRTLHGLARESVSYDADFYRWTQTQAATLRDEALQWLKDLDMDLEHLAEEIEDLGSSHRYAIESQLERLLTHLLKWRYGPAQDPRRLWRQTIRHARREIAKRTGDSPSLRNHPASYLATAYRHAREDVADETGLPLATLPEVCPWAVTQVLDEDYWPEDQP